MKEYFNFSQNENYVRKKNKIEKFESQINNFKNKKWQALQSFKQQQNKIIN